MEAMKSAGEPIAKRDAAENRVGENDRHGAGKPQRQPGQRDDEAAALRR